MKSLYDVPAPAKINLFLHIIGRREDGYHLIQSVFALIDWSDSLSFEVRSDSEISREDLNFDLPASDLIVRAAQALQRATHCKLGVNITVSKSIPVQAGMGGGSSDAASTLLALNRLWNLKLPLSRLMAIGLPLGADIPFFLGGKSAWVEGIGEKISPIELPVAHYLVAKGSAGLDTRVIFSHPNLKRDTAPAIISGFATNGFRDSHSFGKNDLQAVAQELCPGVSQSLEWLKSQGLIGRMTGSGSAVFASVSPERASNLLKEGLRPAAGLLVRVCKGLDVHPLWGWA